MTQLAWTLRAALLCALGVLTACSGQSEPEPPPIPAAPEPAPGATPATEVAPAPSAAPAAPAEPEPEPAPAAPAAAPEPEPKPKPASVRTSSAPTRTPAKPAPTAKPAPSAAERAAAPEPSTPTPPEPPAPPAAPQPAAPEPGPAKPATKVVVPSSAHVRADVPAGLQRLLDADTRMQPWLNRTMKVIDDCYTGELAKRPSASGTITFKLTMHANARPDADIQNLPPQLSGVVACATGQLMRGARMPLFTGPEGQSHTAHVRFTP